MKSFNKTKAAPLKKVVSFLISFIIAFSVYRLFIELGEQVHTMFYYVGVTAYISVIALLVFLFYIKNGFTFSRKEVSAEDLGLGSEAEDLEKLEKLSRSKAVAGKLLKIIVPMILSVVLSYGELVFSDIIGNLIK